MRASVLSLVDQAFLSYLPLQVCVRSVSQVCLGFAHKLRLVLSQLQPTQSHQEYRTEVCSISQVALPEK